MSKQEVVDANLQLHDYVELMKKRLGKTSICKQFLDNIAANPAIAAAAAARWIALPAAIMGEIVDRMAPSGLDDAIKSEVLLDLIAIDHTTLEVYGDGA